MTYLLKSKPKTSRKKIILIIIAVIFVFAVLLKNVSSGIVHTVLYPFNKTVEVVLSPFENFGSYFSSKKDLQQANENLIDENKRLQIELRSIEDLKKENDHLREIMELQRDLENIIVTEVILTPPFSPYDTFVLKGKEGIVPGDAVFAKGILIGFVSEQRGSNFVATLYSSPEETLPVKIRNEIIAEAVGQGSVSFEIELPKETPVEVGDLIYSMTYKDYVVGVIEDIEITETGTFKTVRFQYPFNFADLDFVEVAPGVQVN